MLHKEKHVQFVHKLMHAPETLESIMTEHLKMNAIYWGLSVLDLLDSLPSKEESDEIMKWIMSCRNRDGGFGGAPMHDSHILYTLSAIQSAVILGHLDQIDCDSVVNYIVGLQKPDGSFMGDKFGEIDTRFVYCSCLSLSILGKLDAINQKSAAEYIEKCKNWDGGFGQKESSESHGGQIFCCVGALSLLNRLDIVEKDKLAWWLSERQTSVGGLCGRPEKDPDVCYSWWILSSLAILDRLKWISCDALSAFILHCQDPENGGISDAPDNVADVYHTFFGIAGLSLMGKCDLKRTIDPSYALTHRALESIGINKEKISLPKVEKIKEKKDE
ncbi:putative Geranylgeranyl transferase type-2 subunit beta [Monocercomonoides exilis]|uniref:putative Geranylgeranyl transferase type-2 subunit beta n=1 Tax=Monocercomonoides exilis TaxID=2049356 RepID=UPI0035598712|nr:putative Geranylgeranyl transferase type-2 subunit beta [Monocercomonoides exilis]|eukprot:MONOS_11094.1-p1 / transcript=MONOS_11094.1 / gene=MONOS_11094 / organism=Monocercomonoides_exilis_PA203 / gene_product=Geranylgeranyl transferase type-2 subunit beta / transcript_product=Geranylgeranyl transferase type-2 subunit beta / location=Mono_scaffold00537:24313-25916(-) / protein_length=330 / sequence_SO=supercontig / SO=protein_coding / is_pseudo=false